MIYQIEIKPIHLEGDRGDVIWGDVTNNPVSLAIADHFKPEVGDYCCCYLRTGRNILSILKSRKVIWTIELPEHIEELFEASCDGSLKPCTFILQVPDEVDGVVRYA